MKTKALYGFSPQLAPFRHKTPPEQVALLQSWGVNAIFGGYEEAAFVSAAHRAGMRIYAELACFVGEAWWERAPASRPITETGQPLQQLKWYCGVNPSTPEVRQAQLSAFEALLRDYNLDGVWLDFIRWPCLWEGADPARPRTSFDAATLAQFQRDTGLELPYDNPVSLLLKRYESAWTAWRCEQITTWVAEAKATLKRIKPQATLGLFSIPWRLADFDGAILNIIGQDFQALSEHVDVFSPMVYHAMCGRPPAWIGEVVEEVHALSQKPVWPIIQSVDKPRQLSAEEYGQALDVGLTHPDSGGVLVFTLEGALQPEKLAITQAKLRNRPRR
jgi:hypothetical protein